MDREKIMQFQMMEQEMQQLNSQSEMIEQNIKEMNELKDSLNEIEKNETKEILVNIGKKIYIPVQISKKELVVEVGNKCYVNKSITDTIIIADEQLKKLIIAKTQIADRLAEIEMDLSKMIESENHSHSNGHMHSHECNCGEDCEGGKCEDCECETEESEE